MRSLSFKLHRFPPEIICHAVWLYFRFTMTLRDVEDLLAERGIDVTRSLSSVISLPEELCETSGRPPWPGGTPRPQMLDEISASGLSALEGI